MNDTDASRHWVEIQLPHSTDEDDTIGFYVVGHTDDIKDSLFPVLMTSNFDDRRYPIPCSIIAVESTE